MKKVPPWAWIVIGAIALQWGGVIDLPIVRDIVEALKGFIG